MENNNYRQEEQDRRISSLEKDVKEIILNHLPHLQKSVSEIKTDIAWLKRFFFIVAAASISALMIQVFSFLLKR